MKTLLLFMRRLGVTLAGVPIQTAWYFAAWSGGGNYTRLRKLSIKARQISYIPTGASLPVELLHYFSRDVNQLCDVLEQFKPVVHDGKLLLTAVSSNNELSVLLESSQSLFVFREIFDEEVYGFALSTPCVVVDVGMNIGIASLYFAAMPGVSAIYSYELVPSNFVAAEKNMQLNPTLRSKIKTFDYGWGSAERSFVIDRPADGVTDLSISHQPANAREPSGGSDTLTVHVKDAAEEMNQILSTHSDKPIVVKMDCEGAEYEIIHHLSATGILNRITGIMIEWHKLGHEPITAHLLAAGMKVFYRKDKNFNGQVGMIYAWR